MNVRILSHAFSIFFNFFFFFALIKLRIQNTFFDSITIRRKETWNSNEKKTHFFFFFNKESQEVLKEKKTYLEIKLKNTRDNKYVCLPYE